MNDSYLISLGKFLLRMHRQYFATTFAVWYVRCSVT